MSRIWVCESPWGIFATAASTASAAATWAQSHIVHNLGREDGDIVSVRRLDLEEPVPAGAVMI